MIAPLCSPTCKMLAEKVETPHEFQQARDMDSYTSRDIFFAGPKS